ncbi:MAG: molybdopterin converting factor subunit 1 [Anaerolineales bacterium]
MNTVNVYFFATLRDKARTDKTSLELPDQSTVYDLKQTLFEVFPDLPRNSSTMLVAVNKEYAFDEDVIPQSAEIALFPPVSGGVDLPTIFAVTQDELDLNSILNQITLPTTGASCFFSGVVRGKTQRGAAHDTEYLVYEAYVPMAEEKMRQVADEIREQWPEIEGIAIVQRIGKLMPGTPTVMIACTAGHRDTGIFEAARYGIDRLKEIVPIWKKEVGPKGEVWVEGEYVPSPGD